MEKICIYIILPIFSILLLQPAFSQTNISNILSCGPRNKLDVKYATLYVIRTNDTVDVDKWYALMYETTALGRLENNSKCEIRFPLDGKKRFWSQYDPSLPSSGVDIDLEYGKSYYLRLQIIAGTNHSRPELLLMDSIKGKAEYDEFNSNTSVLYYPVPSALPESMMGGNAFNRKILYPFYYKPIDTFYLWRYKFNVPSYFQYAYFSNKYFSYQFAYKNLILSSTYSEFLRLQAAATREVKSAEDFLNYLKKSLGTGPKNKKEKLVSLNYEPISGLGDFGWMAISEIEDHMAANKKENGFLLLREIRACFYKDLNSKSNVMIVLWLSARGTKEELYTLDEMKERLRQFVNGWQYLDDIKVDEVPEETDVNQ